jgi:soluble lytic murein transglycosylase-like protein
MAKLRTLVGLLCSSLFVTSCWAGLEELARVGQWEQLLAVAGRRSEQLPLSGEEAFLAAFAARELGESEFQLHYLTLAADGGPLAEIAGLELAQLLVESNRDQAVGLVLPTVRKAPTRPMREAAVAIAVEALQNGVENSSRISLEHATRGLPRYLRRQLQLALAATDGAGARQQLGHLLASSRRDLEALAAVRLLQAEPNLTAQERWWVAETLYRHALYREAVPLLESLDDVHHRSVPRWQVAFLRGRCAFRLGRWDEAAAWYQEALERAGGGERAAEVAGHLGRALELGGRMNEAVAAGQRALRLRTTDDRRLFLARLRLRLDQPEHAEHGISRVRTSSARARGETMLALYRLRHGERDEARRQLEKVRRRPWSGPAGVLAAQLAAENGELEEVIVLLERAAPGLDPFWAVRARELMASLPNEQRTAWRARCAESVDEAAGRARWRSLGRWATLETEATSLLSLQAVVAREAGLAEDDGPPHFDPGIAAELWLLGLDSAAVRWDPTGMPRHDARSTLWSAQRFDDLGFPKRAIQVADAAWRMAGSEVPTRAFPVDLRRTLYPLPDPDLVWRSSLESGVPWSLVAALAREESRWEPHAVSRVGARGVMQLMPMTASEVAARRGEALDNPEMLFDPAVSLRLGAAEMRRLLDEFDGRWAPAVAAYNAGESQARLWLAQCGQDCTEELYVANISFAATSRYTRDVLATAAAYTEVYGPALGPITAAKTVSRPTGEPVPER